jgi:hypothetical protein
MAENYTLTRDKAIELLERAVAEKGEDFVYTSPVRGSGVCQYIDDSNNPSCIVGHAFKYLSDELGNHDIFAELNEHEGSSAHDIVLPGVTITPKASMVLAIAQDVQDSMEYTWGNALERAREH